MGSGASQPASPPVVYSFPLSPPCRAVLMTSEILKVSLKVNQIDLTKGEHKSDTFLKINPDHTLPTLVDGTLTLWESRAIQQYLVDRYAPNHALYPRDPVTRARVDRVLQYDLSVVAPTLTGYARDRLLLNQAADPEREKKVDAVLEYLDNLLKSQDHLAGATLTLADLSVVASVGMVELLQWDLARFPRLHAWYQGLQRHAWYKKVNAPLEEMKQKQAEKQTE